MKRFIFLVMILLLSGCQESSLTGEIIYVVDGDTLDVQFEDGTEERIRLLLIDTPETKHPTIGVEPFGPEASEFTSQFEGDQVELELDVSERDRYGRLLAYVWLDDQMLNEMILKEGLARVSVYPPNTKYVDEFRDIERKAKTDEKGIWSVENYQHADKGSSEKSDESCNIKGNINSRGDKIYHTESSAYYEQTIPEEWFCTEADAIEAGFRAPR
ncbi:thermonuclease [Jeotgalibacillus alimentarius]|uniref:Thermonuclease n=1 Tax=Jeotgalibacillus alimentarius TaxID=135826 RepID=A0A0C2S419_9BACL|nr:thermonuclease family protein [Jeotgalibacillus alimentarius]KIL48754.1 thermonuclease [Jeotgalibacillus alimentarius]